MGQERLSTGQAAKICSVTSDTVLRWIKSGKLPATRTPGGHYRISRKELIARRSSLGERPIRYCWEYNAENGEPLEKCEKCIVFRSRTLRCYELAALPRELGHSRIFCEESCDDCEYYRLVRGQTANVIVVTGNRRTQSSLLRSALGAPFNLEVVDSMYSLSALIGTFRPDFVVMDCEADPERTSEIVGYLQADRRLKLVRIILVTGPGGLPGGCENGVFAQIETPLTFEQLERTIREVRLSIW